MKLSDKQLKLVDAQIKRLIKTDSFYGKKYRERSDESLYRSA